MFRFLQGDEVERKFDHLLVAQFNMRKKFLKLIDNEIKNATEGKETSIIIKLNSLEDPKMIRKLYQASQAGVKINIIVRGICCLVPGVKGLSDNITCISILDRFLEHARFYVFHNDGDEKIYASSADWMKRNLSRRIEVAFPIYDINIKKEIKKILHFQINDNVKARIIDKNDRNRYQSKKLETQIPSQIATYEYFKQNN